MAGTVSGERELRPRFEEAAKLCRPLAGRTASSRTQPWRTPSERSPAHISVDVRLAVEALLLGVPLCTRQVFNRFLRHVKDRHASYDGHCPPWDLHLPSSEPEARARVDAHRDQAPASSRFTSVIVPTSAPSDE